MSAATLTYRGRLPGVAVDPALPAVDQPVRLDVAGFVGFAERGPIDTPTVVEDPAQYAAVFGGDLALAQDDGTPVWAQLPSTVRAFFDNGGRRCYVVRVAGGATSGRWVVPGLQLWRPGTTVTPEVVVEAAWPGAWSQGLAVATTLLGTQLARPGAYQPTADGAYGVLPVARRALVDVQSGDLLRIELEAGGGLFARAQAIEAVDPTDPSGGRVLVSTELPFGSDGRPSITPMGTTALPVSSARLLRLELSIARGRDGRAPEAERWSDLAFGRPDSGTAARPCWTDVLQTGLAPDLSRSRLLREVASTTGLMADHLVVPADTQAGAIQQDGTDGLDVFPIVAFTDDRLVGASVFSVLPEADQLTSLAHDPQPEDRLRGVHALLTIDEVALVAIPDATHRGWTRPPPPEKDPVPAAPPVIPPAPDWADFHCCEVTPPGSGTTGADLAPPEPTELDGLPPLDPIASYDNDALVATQVALVTMCAARADQLAILSVPRHYDVAATLAWRERLHGDGQLTQTTGTATPALGYAGLWHPWVSVPAGTSDAVAVLRDVPPDGIAAGCIAARELDRGPWLAPAGTPLRGLLRTVPELTRAEQVSLFNAHANLVTHPPGSFTLLSAHTLTDDRALLQVSVRRLLIWIRKTALRLGQRYVFEVDNDQFRQLVQLRFDRLLRRLVDLGALAAYRVVVSPTPADLDNGLLVVQLQVAPTSPVEFITVTLTRTGEGLLDVLEV